MLRIRGGTLVSDTNLLRADLLISAGQIIGQVHRDTELNGFDTVDASDRFVLPGLVDLHAHARTPGYEYKEDFTTVSMAAAAGGITTYVDMPNVDPPTVTADLLIEKRRMADAASLLDWGHFASGSQVDRVPELAAAGATGFKIFMVGGGYPHDDRIAVSSHRDLFRAMRAIADTGLLCLVHPFDQSLFDMFTEEAFAAGRPRDHVTRADLYVGIDIIWRSAITTLIEFQKESGVRLQVLHTHARGSLELLRQAKQAGSSISVAIDPKYFHLTEEDLVRLGPRSYHGAAITKDPEHLDAIWRALNDGTIDLIDSDHGPHTLEEVEQARTDAWKAPLGNPQYDDLLSLLLTDVNEGRMSLNQVVKLCSANPARLIGRYPEKGALGVGSDADVTIVDLAPTRVVRDEDEFTKVKWSPYAGRTLKGVPVATYSRGRLVARDREIVDDRPLGRYLEGVPQKMLPGSAVQSPAMWMAPR